MTIRPFDATRDYPALTQLNNTNFPDSATSESEVRYHDDYREPSHHFARFVVEEKGQVIASASWSQSVYNYHPKHFMLGISVLPECQKRGVGAMLWSHLPLK